MNKIQNLLLFSKENNLNLEILNLTKNEYGLYENNKDILKNLENYDFFDNKEIRIFVIKNSFSNKWKTKK